MVVKRKGMKHHKLVGILFFACLFGCLVFGGTGKDDAVERFEPLRVAEGISDTLQAALSFEPGSVLKVSMRDVNVGPIEKRVSPVDVLRGRVRYGARASVVPQIESEKHVVKSQPFFFDVESDSFEGIKSQVDAHVTSLQESLHKSLQMRGLVAKV